MTNSTDKTVELIFDFVSPNGYLIWGPLKDIVHDHGATLKITPVFLGGMHKLTGNAPPFIRDAEVKGKNAYAMTEMNRYIARHGLDQFAMNPKFPFNSITLLRLLLAVEPSQQDALAELFLAAIWEDGIDGSDAEAIAAVLENAGFGAEDLLARTQDPAIKQQLMDNTEEAVERGAFGIPTMFVNIAGDTGAGEEMFFGKERLGQIEEMLSAD